MLKNIFYVILLFLSLHLNGQTFRLGAISGMNVSKLTGNDNSAFNHLGYKIGGRIGIDVHRRFRTSMDLLYSRKGNTVSLSPSTSVEFKNIRLDYVEVPLILSFMDWMDDPDEQDYYRLHFTIGVSFSRLVNFRVRNNWDEDVTEQQSFNKNKISALGGLVYYPNEHLGINLQYAHSFSNLEKGNPSPKMKGRTWSLNLIYMLHNKRRAIKKGEENSILNNI